MLSYVFPGCLVAAGIVGMLLFAWNIWVRIESQPPTSAEQWLLSNGQIVEWDEEECGFQEAKLGRRRSVAVRASPEQEAMWWECMERRMRRLDDSRPSLVRKVTP